MENLNKIENDIIEEVMINTEVDEIAEAKNGYCKFFKYLIVFVLCFLCSKYIFGFVTVVGPSMEKTFIEGDFCGVKKFNYEVERYDVVVADIGPQKVIKRVIGLPGETIRIFNGVVYIDGNKIDDEYDIYSSTPVGENASLILEDNEYFLLGDNRSQSADSRNFGAVKKESIEGKVVIRIFPFNRFKTDFKELIK